MFEKLIRGVVYLLKLFSDMEKERQNREKKMKQSPYYQQSHKTYLSFTQNVLT